MVKSFALLILDGWGYSPKNTGNAIFMADTPNFDRLYKTYPHGLIDTHGSAVGLPDDQFGNSEIGHMTLSAGRKIPQILTLINEALSKDPGQALIPLTSNLNCLHIMGLLSSGGVHSHINHTVNIVNYLATNFPTLSIYIHAFTDGRDTSTQAAITELSLISALEAQHPHVHFASLCGRYYAMDRDNNWDRTQQCQSMLTVPSTTKNQPYKDVLEQYYQQNINDEFIPPTQLPSFKPIGKDDTVLFTNFRADRAIQLSNSLTKPDDLLNINLQPKRFFSLTPYPNTTPSIQPIFKAPTIHNHLGEVFAHHALTQLRIAETEKFAHVTYFFNGGKPQKSIGESHLLIPSPNVPTFDTKPEMSAEEITSNILKTIEENTFDVIIANFANADMVGHTGNMKATIKAIETLDKCIGQIVNCMEKNQWQGLITADHGNAEVMIENNQPVTTHSLNPVPIITISKQNHTIRHHGSITQIAPTILDLMGIKPPTEMSTESSLILWS